MFQIDLSANNELLVILPTGRPIEISASPEGISYIKKMILDYRRGVAKAGYIKSLPTQHAVDKEFADSFLKAKREKSDEERLEAASAKLGFDVKELNFEI